MRGRSTEVDDYGYDPAAEARWTPFLTTLAKSYFRLQLEGAEHIPRSGGAIIVCNHSGALPLDAIMLRHNLAQTATGRKVRPLVGDYLFHAPFLGTTLRQLGAVRAHPDNALRLLDEGELVAVFPEGQKGPAKLFKDRYHLQRFGRGGFVKLALRAGVPIIPVAIVGAEESYPLLGKLKRLGKTMGFSYMPLTPTFPWFGPLGLAPLPSRWRIHVGAPVDVAAELPPNAEDDRHQISRLAGDIRMKVQSLLDQAQAARGASYFG